MSHLKGVYACLGMSVVALTIGTSIPMLVDIFQTRTTAFLGSLLFFLLLLVTPDYGTNTSRRVGFLLGFAAAMGLLMGPSVKALAKNNFNIVTATLMDTFVTFTSLTAFALAADTGYWLYLKGPLLSLLSFLVYLNIGDILFGGALLLEQIDVYLGLLVMCGYVLYDTQFVDTEVRQGKKDHVLHAMTLLINLIGIFVRVLKIRSQWRSSPKKA